MSIITNIKINCFEINYLDMAAKTISTSVKID